VCLEWDIPKIQTNNVVKMTKIQTNNEGKMTKIQTNDA
jgi:hypothetical protein